MIIRDLPLDKWFIAIIFIVFSIFIILSNQFQENNLLAFGLGFLILVTHSLALFFLTIAFPLITIRIHKSDETITVRKWSLVKVETASWLFKEVNGLIFVEGNEKNSPDGWHLILRLKGGEKIRVSTEGLRESRIEAAGRINEYLCYDLEQKTFDKMP